MTTLTQARRAFSMLDAIVAATLFLLLLFPLWYLHWDTIKAHADVFGLAVTAMYAAVIVLADAHGDRDDS